MVNSSVCTAQFESMNATRVVGADLASAYASRKEERKMRSYTFLFVACQLSLLVAGSSFAADYINARFDNLTTTVGLNDDFNDGVIDTALWTVEKARVGYGIWRLARCDPPPFIAASEQGGELEIAGYTCEYFDYSRVLVSKETYSGPLTLEVDLISLSGSGSQWGAGPAIVKDDFSAIQLLQSVHHWMAWPAGQYVFSWRARYSCISGTPGCPESPGWQGTPEIGYGEVFGPGALTFPIRFKIVFDGTSTFTLYWKMGAVEYQSTQVAPEVYDSYRIVLHGSARLGDTPLPPECFDGLDNDGNGCADYPTDTGCSSASDPTEAGGSCNPPAIPDLTISGLATLVLCLIFAGGLFLALRKAQAHH